jgi:hypothetical protein
MAKICITSPTEYLIVLPSGERYTADGSFTEVRSLVGIQGQNASIRQRKNEESEFGLELNWDANGYINLDTGLMKKGGGIYYLRPMLFCWTKEEFLNMPVVTKTSTSS